MADEVYVEPKGAICISLALDADTSEIIGLTHRLNDDEWTTFKNIKEDTLQDALAEVETVFTNAITDSLSSSSPEN